MLISCQGSQQATELLTLDSNHSGPVSIIECMAYTASSWLQCRHTTAVASNLLIPCSYMAARPSNMERASSTTALLHDAADCAAFFTVTQVTGARLPPRDIVLVVAVGGGAQVRHRRGNLALGHLGGRARMVQPLPAQYAPALQRRHRRRRRQLALLRARHQDQQ